VRRDTPVQKAHGMNNKKHFHLKNRYPFIIGRMIKKAPPFERGSHEKNGKIAFGQ